MVLLVWAMFALGAATLPPNQAQAIIGFKVGGFCAIGCGSDSWANQRAADVGAAFSDKAVANFGREARTVVDYADKKAGRRMEQLETMMDEQRNSAIAQLAEQREAAVGQIDEQRQLLSDDFSQQVQLLLVDASSISRTFIVEAGIAAGQRLNQLDRSLQASVSTLSLSLWTVAGALIGAMFAFFGLLAAFMKHRSVGRLAQLTAIAVVIVGGSVGAAAAAANNIVLERSRVAELRKEMHRHIGYNRLDEAYIYATQISSLTKKPADEFAASAIGVYRAAFFGLTFGARDELLDIAAEAQRRRREASLTPSADPDLASAQVLLLSEAVDSYIGRQILRGVLNVSMPKQNSEILLSKDQLGAFFLLECALLQDLTLRLDPKLSRSLDQLSAMDVTASVEGDFREKYLGFSNEEVSGIPKSFACPREVQIPAQERWARRAHSTIEARILAKRWNRMANTIEIACLFARECFTAGELKQIAQSANAEFSDAIDRGIPVPPPTRLWAALTFADWSRGRLQFWTIDEESVEGGEGIVRKRLGTNPETFDLARVSDRDLKEMAQQDDSKREGNLLVRRAYGDMKLRSYMRAVVEYGYWMELARIAQGINEITNAQVAAVSDTNPKNIQEIASEKLPVLVWSTICVLRDGENVQLDATCRADGSVAVGMEYLGWWSPSGGLSPGEATTLNLAFGA